MKKTLLSNKWARRNNHDISRPSAIFFAATLLLLATMFANTFFTNRPIDKASAEEKTAIFDHYEFEYGRYSLSYAVLFFENNEHQQIRGICVNKDLTDAITTLEPGTKLHMLINSNNDSIIELKTDSKELLNFDYTQKKLRQAGVGSLYFAIFMLMLCGYFVYKAITTKERITKADLEFYLDIMRKK